MPAQVVRGKFAVPVDPTAVDRDWEARGFSCDPFVDPPGRTWTGFVHATDELVTVVAGRLDMTVGPERFLVEPGDEVLIPRGVVHSVRNIHDGPTRWLYGYN